MRWSQLFQSSRNQAWEPVTDELDSTDVDDLMRMASGQFVGEDQTVPLLQNGYGDEINHGEPVFHHSRTSTPADEHQGHDSYRTLYRLSCLCGVPRLSFPSRKWYLILLSFLLPIIFIGINVGLGVYSLLYYKPDDLMIDKSVKSFSIPNHEAYIHFEALMLARKDASSRRRKRDVGGMENFANSNLLSDSVMKKKETLSSGGSLNEIKSSEPAQLFRKNKDKFEFQPGLFPYWSESIESDGSISSTLNNWFRRLKRDTQEVRCLFNYQSQIIARWKMHVIYLAKGSNDTNMFTKERLETVHAIEKRIIEHPGFHNFCLRDPDMERKDPAIQDMNGCVPLNSLLTYFYPSKSNDGRILYDGLGTNIDDIDSALKLAMNQETFYYFVDDKINKTYQKSHLLRSEVLFGAPLPGFSCASDKREDQDIKFREFVVTYIDLLSKASTDHVQVLYGGNEIFDYEVTSSFWSDVKLAVISLILIFSLMLVLTLSPYLTVAGILVIALSFPISLFFYRVVFQIDALGILNGAAAFVIIGIGVDDVFVFINIYRQSSHFENPVKRVWMTIKTAGVATFFTSFTTAAAFAANLASAIPAVYEFGLFMSLIVSSCWVSVIILMPPSLYLYACLFEPIEMAIFSCFTCKKARADDSEPIRDNVEHYTADQSQHLYDDDDVPMLSMDYDDPSPGFMTTDDDILLMDDPTENTIRGQLHLSSPNSSEGEVIGTEFHGVSNNTVCLGRILQKTMMFFTNRIVIRGRYVIIAFYIAVLIASCALMTRIRPATHPPQLFRPDTNLQQLLDLKANFSIIDTLHCDQCSGLYKVHSGVPTTPPPPAAHPRQHVHTTKPTENTENSSRGSVVLPPPPIPPPTSVQNSTGTTKTTTMTTTKLNPSTLSTRVTTSASKAPPHAKPSQNSQSNFITNALSKVGNIPLPAKALAATLAQFLSPHSSTTTNSSLGSSATDVSGAKSNDDQSHETKFSFGDLLKNLMGDNTDTKNNDDNTNSLASEAEDSAVKEPNSNINPLFIGQSSNGSGNTDNNNQGPDVDSKRDPSSSHGSWDDYYQYKRNKELQHYKETHPENKDNNPFGTAPPPTSSLSANHSSSPAPWLRRSLLSPSQSLASSSSSSSSSSSPSPSSAPLHNGFADVIRALEDGIKELLPKGKQSESVDENFNVCQEQKCGDLKDRPLMEMGATVYVVFGVAGVNRSDDDKGHVLDQYKDGVIYDEQFFDRMNNKSLLLANLKELCQVCHILANRTDLVKEGSAQCIPDAPGLFYLQKALAAIPECRNLPSSLSIYHHQAPAHAEGDVESNGRVRWLAFAFESTTSEGLAYFEAYKEYMKWEELMEHIKKNVLRPNSPLHGIFQTSQFWTKVMMEVVAVNSAIYGLIFSMLICVVAVAVFTGHFLLLLIVVITILAVICTVVGLFYLIGWEMGAVEAVSLSILVGSSVDYCVHVVEGFILAGRRMPEFWMKQQPKSSLRAQRTSLAVRHIGVAILCSALTTVVAAIPLTCTFIQPFAKFGSILLINTTVSVFMTMTLAVAMLATFGPARYRGTWKSHLIAAVVTVLVVGALILGLFIAAQAGVNIPSPSGSNLFK